MQKNTLLKVGVAGSLLAALCCFTPLLVVLLGVLGLATWVGYLDVVLLPILFLFLGLTIYALFHKGGNDEQNHHS